MKSMGKILQSIKNGNSGECDISQGHPHGEGHSTQTRNFISGTLDQRNIVSLSPQDTLIDRFIVIKPLGQGRLGTVYLAKDTLRGIDVALKVVEIGPLSNETASLILNHEINIYNQIKEPQCIIRIFDLHSVPWGGTSLLVMSMEYAEGGTFRTWLKNHKEDLQTRKTLGVEYFKMICSGVGTIHDSHVVHLDLKPENFLFSNNIFKVSDFETALTAEQSCHEDICNTQGLNFFNGTPVYMSPEHFLAPHPEDLGPKADIYSLGVVLFELLHPDCRVPFGGDYHRLCNLHLNIQAPKLPAAEEYFTGIVAACLNKNPEDRYQSVWDLLEDLENGCCRFNDVIGLRADSEQDSSDEVAEMLHTASHHFLQKNYKQAYGWVQKILTADPGNLKANQLQEELQSRYERAQEFYQIIESRLQEGGVLQELTQLLSEAVNLYPEHPSGHLIQTKLVIKADEYKNSMEQGLLALKDKRWESALELFEKAYELNPQAKNLIPLLKTLRKLKGWREQIDFFLRDGNFKQALIIANLVDHHVEEMMDTMRVFENDFEFENTSG